MTESLIIKELGTDIEVHGYRVLIKAVKLPEKTGKGVFIPESYRNAESRGHNIGLVLKMGPMAYQPLEKFGGKPYCSLGDWVVYSSYERDEITIKDHLCYFVNDERIYATLPDINVIMKNV